MKEKTRLRILQMMRENPHGFTVSAMADELDMEEKATGKSLEGLVRDGFLDRVRNNRCIAFGKAMYFYRPRTETGDGR